MPKYTNEHPFTTTELCQLPPDTILDTGTCEDSEDGIYLSGTGYKLKWVAKTSAANDWCIYYHFENYSDEFILQHGQKVRLKEEIKRCIPCTDEVLTRYRY